MKALLRRGAIVAIIAVLLLAGAGWLALSGPSLFLDRLMNRWLFNPNALSSTERAQLSELVLTVAEEPQESMAEARERVWAIVRAHGAGPDAARRALEPIFVRIGHGPKLFWTDARQAVAEHRPVKSEARTQWEAELLGEGWLTMAQQQRYDDFMARIARGEPIESSHGVDVALDDRMIKAINESLDERELRRTVAELLTPPG
ncbi:MAG TPA: hypothetical protein VEI24_06685 [Nitrospiria bacterium]|nr:hypothetical protein [Nitrospiria bacterium]